MQTTVSIALLGDFNEKKHTHVALNDSIRHAAKHLPFTLETTWVPTSRISSDFLQRHHYAGFWVTPGSPYINDEGVYSAIRHARETHFPCLGTCGGFQYMVVEYARQVLGFNQAGHEESEPDAGQLLITRLACSLKGQQEIVNITNRDSWIYRVLGKDQITGHFNCSFGVNAAYQNKVDKYPFVFTAFSPDGQPRALELKNHPFFCGTLFQPPLDSTSDQPNPLLLDFFQVCAKD